MSTTRGRPLRDPLASRNNQVLSTGTEREPRMTKRLRSLFAFAAFATMLVADASWNAGPTLHVNEAQAQRRKKKPKPKPTPAPEQTPAPGEKPGEPVIEIEPE